MVEIIENKPTILITGFAGFVGVNLTARFMQEYNIVGVDNLSSPVSAVYYAARLHTLGIDETEWRQKGKVSRQAHVFLFADITNSLEVEQLFRDYKLDGIIHLAALTGVRQSFDAPLAYFNANVNGFLLLIQNAHKHNIQPFIYASSSSVYGHQPNHTFSEEEVCDSPASLYAVTKLADELTAKTYYNALNYSSLGLRFFTVYGPWNRPDMAAYIFAEAIQHGQPINLYQNGALIRDFTYVGDVVESIRLILKGCLDQTIKMEGAELVNIGGGQPLAVNEFVQTMATQLNKTPVLRLAERQVGDVEFTHASNDKLRRLIGFTPATSLHQGIASFVDWYLTHQNKAE
jgi:UDP-glucuronate 4-epimerase